MATSLQRPLCAALLLVVSLAGPPASAQVTFEGLYAPPGRAGVSQIQGVSGDGRRVVGYDDGSNPSSNGLYWDAGAGASPVVLPMIPGQSAMIALGISADGQTIVGQNYGSGSPTYSPAYRWNSLTGTASISPPFTGSDLYDRAYATNANGSVVVGIRGGGQPTFQGFRWTAGGGMVVLPNLPSTQPGSSPNGVSGDGQVAVGDSTTDIPDPVFPGGFAHYARAVRWDGTGDPTPLPYLPGAAILSSSATAANQDGSVIVGLSNSSLGRQAALWTSSGVQGLGFVPGAVSSAAFSTDATGSLVTGISNFSAGPAQAFFWSQGTGIRTLKDYVISKEPSLSSALDNWNLQNAYISADGTTFAGLATDPLNRTVGYRLSRVGGWLAAAAPEPSALVLTAVGGIFLVRRRRAPKPLPRQFHT